MNSESTMVFGICSFGIRTTPRAYEVIYKLEKRKMQGQELGTKWASGMVIGNLVL